MRWQEGQCAGFVCFPRSNPAPDSVKVVKFYWHDECILFRNKIGSWEIFVVD
jgi:hypothetical protein